MLICLRVFGYGRACEQRYLAGCYCSKTCTRFSSYCETWQRIYDTIRLERKRGRSKNREQSDDVRVRKEETNDILVEAAFSAFEFLRGTRSINVRDNA